VLVAATERGLCAILLGESESELLADLKTRLPRATLAKPSPEFADWVRKVVRFVDNPAQAGGLALPLDVRGTAFQRRVWEVLREIPAGETATYAAVAGRLGSPRAARAVAGACAANALAIAIPCHRVVAAKGGLGGYRWGVQRKQELLDREQNDV
jgi:AraC family transcriptional regulator of adaptative response/methylated-DNA-[protein]-cysteine methyltransferase